MSDKWKDFVFGVVVWVLFVVWLVCVGALIASFAEQRARTVTERVLMECVSSGSCELAPVGGRYD